MARRRRDEGRKPSDSAPWDWEALYFQWCAQDLPPSDFKRQTPRTLVLTLEGRAKAVERDIELAMFTAWQTVIFERTKKLESLKHYLDSLSPPKPGKKQTPAELIAAMRAVKATLH
jgi:hypothetical protein